MMDSMQFLDWYQFFHIKKITVSPSDDQYLIFRVDEPVYEEGKELYRITPKIENGKTTWKHVSGDIGQDNVDRIGRFIEEKMWGNPDE